MIASRWLWAGIAAAAATAAAAALLFLRSDTADISLPEVSLPQENAVQQAELPVQICPAEESEPEFPDTAYLIKLNGDVLSVYAEGIREPVEQYELPAGWLPDYDRILLEYGMRVQNAAELRECMEDYLS